VDRSFTKGTKRLLKTILIDLESLEDALRRTMEIEDNNEENIGRSEWGA